MPDPLLTTLKRCFSNQNVTELLAVLRQDPHVWAAVQQTQILEKLSEYPETWFKPAGIFSLINGLPYPAIREDNADLFQIDQLQEASANFNKRLVDQLPPESLDDAGWLAIALREYWSDGMLSGLETMQYSVWCTPLACWYGLIKDGKQLLCTLIEKGEKGVHWALYIVFTNIIHQEDQRRMLLDLFQNSTIDQQIDCLKWIGKQGRLELKKKLAADFYAISTKAGTNMTMNDIVPPSLLSGEKIGEIQKRAILLQMAGLEESAMSHFSTVENQLRFWMAVINLQRADALTALENNDSAQLAAKRAMKLAPELASIKEQALLLLDEDNWSISDINKDDFSPILKIIIAARLSKCGQEVRCREIAKTAVQKWLDEISLSASPLLVRNEYSHDALKGLLSLRLVEEAKLTYARMLQMSPNDCRLIKIGSDIFEMAGDLSLAIQNQELLTTYLPRNIDDLRKLAIMYEKKMDWKSALETWKILCTDVTATRTDHLCFAESAIHAEHPEEAVNECKTLINQDPDSGLAHALMGEAMLMLNEMESGMQHLGLATLLNPEEPKSWLKLSEAYLKIKEGNRALDTLRAAVAATGGDGTIHLAFGNLLIETGMIAESLSHLEKAYELFPEDIDASLSLASALEKLGFDRKALDILSKIKRNLSTDPRILALEGKIHLADKNYEQAYFAWSKAIESNNVPIDWYLGYAQSLLGLGDDQIEGRLGKAYKAIQGVLDVDKENILARYALGNLLAQQKDYESAFSIYSSLLETTEAEDINWQICVKTEYGRMARHLGLPDTAITAFREIVEEKPEAIDIQMELSDILRDVGLYAESMNTGESVLDVQPENPTILRWYGNLACDCGDTGVGKEALLKAVDLKPDFWAAWLDLSALDIRLGDKDEAVIKLKQFYTTGNHSPGDWWCAAALYESINDHLLALDCLERLTQIAGKESARLWLQKALLADKSGDIESANRMVLKSIQIDPQCSAVLTYQADLLVTLGRPQAAFQVLEQAIKLSGNESEHIIEKWESAKLVSELLPESWYQKMNNPAGMYLRIAQLHLQAGNMEFALQNAETALSINPQLQNARMIAADVSMSMLKLDKARSVLDLTEKAMGTQTSGFDAYISATLYGMRAELELMANQIERAEADLEIGLSFGCDCARLMAVKTRCLAIRGDYLTANQVLNAVVNNIEAERNATHARLADWGEVVLRDRCNISYPLWLGEAFISLGRWPEGLRLLKHYVQEKPNELIGQAVYIQRMIEGVDLVDTFSQVNVKSRMLDGIDLPEEHKKLENIINTLSRHSSSFQPARWLAMANVVYQPLGHNLRTLESMGLLPEDAGIAASGWRKAGNIEEVRRLVNQYPENCNVLIQMALASMDDDCKQGIQFARKAAELQVTNPIVHAVCARFEELAGNEMAALAELNHALNLWPDQASWYAWAGKLNEKTNELGASQTAWEQAVAQHPGEIEYILGLANIYLRREQYSRAVETALMATRLDAQRYDAWMILGQAYESNGNYENALLCAQKASEVAPEEFEPRMLAGKTALKLGQFDQSAHYSQAALMIDPENNDALQLMVDVYLSQGQPETALALLEKSQPVGKDSVSLGLTRANLIRKVRGTKEARDVYKQLVTAYPECSEVWGELARAEAADHNVEAAITAANRAMKLNVQQHDLMNLMGKMCLEAGHLDKAIFYLAEAVRQKPGNVDAYLELGKAYLLQRQVAEAMKVYKQAMHSAPEDYRSYYYAALAQRENKEYFQAETLLRKAANLAPDNILIRRQLAAVIALNMVYQAQEASS